MMRSILNHLSLRWLLIINVIVPLVFAITAASYIGLRVLEHIVEEKMQEDVQLVARAIRLPVSYSLEKERFGSVSQAIQSVFRIGRIYSAYVYDSDGKIIAEVGGLEPDKHKDDLKNVAKTGERTGRYENIQGRRVYSYFVPLFDTSGKSNGLIQITRKKSDFENFIHELRIRVALILAGASLFIAGFVLFGFQKAAGQFFSGLTQSMTRIQKGERSHRAATQGPKEIRALAETFNAMLDNLDQSEMEIAERRKEQQALEYKLQQNEKMAAIGRLAAGVAHELGAPLSLVDGKAQRCLRDDTLKTAHHNSLRDIRAQVRHMSDIVRQLLDFGKGARRPKHRTRAGHIAGSALSAAEKEADGKISFIPAGPDPGPPIEVDPLHFEQALANLLRNAAQMEETTTIRLDWGASEDGGVFFTVEDDGPGISDEIKPNIFEPFFSMKKSAGNAGMGLSIVHGIIAEHDGTISVYDTGAGGAGFRITLPAAGERQHKDKGQQNA